MEEEDEIPSFSVLDYKHQVRFSKDRGHSPPPLLNFHGVLKVTDFFLDYLNIYSKHGVFSPQS